MGDIKTHREIWDTFVRPHLPADVDPIYVELGNYLTDVSQFRDPWAHVGGKVSVWDREISGFAPKTLFIDIFGGDNYLDFLLGRPDDNDPKGRLRAPYGKLAEWFREVIYVVALEKSFRSHDPPFDYLIPPDDFKRLYDSYFTQYFPHEHVDFKPGPEGRLDDFAPSDVDASLGGKRRIVAYLEADIEYIGDLLSRIERDWARSGAVTRAAQLDQLVRLGHALHAVEDYFFHSNFVELAHGFANPGPDGQRFDSVRGDRIYFRRRRLPIYGPDGETSYDKDKPSVDANFTFTAAIPFGDIFHTFFDAIGHLSDDRGIDVMPIVESILKACESELSTGEMLRLLLQQDPLHLKEIPYALLGKFVPKEEETDQDRADRAKAYRAYRCLIEHDLMTRMYQFLANHGLVHRSVAEAVTKACIIEREVWSYLPGFVIRLQRLLGRPDETGAARFMITLLEQGRTDVTNARHASEALDETNETEKQKLPEERSGYVLSDNGSSAERIGTHALMSKDSIRKEPLRHDAINGAGFTVSYLTKTMVSQRSDGSPVEAGVDWHELLRHFITYPEQAGPGPGSEWWREAMKWDRKEVNRPPEGHQVRTVPLAPPNGPTEPDASRRARTIAERAAERRRSQLMLQYNDLSAVGEKRFRDAVNSDWVFGSMAWSSVLGGFAGLIGSWTDDVETLVLGTMSGAAAGVVAGGLLSGVGTAVNDRAGSVVGLLAGVGAAAVGGYAMGSLVGDAS